MWHLAYKSSDIFEMRQDRTPPSISPTLTERHRPLTGKVDQIPRVQSIVSCKQHQMTARLAAKYNLPEQTTTDHTDTLLIMTGYDHFGP